MVKSEKEFHDAIEQLKRDVTFQIQKRERPDRHPYQIGCLSGLLIVSIAQAILGVPPESALYDIAARLTIIAIDMTFIVGATLCLGGALNRDKHFELSLRLGIYGHCSVFTGCLFYSAIVIVSTRPELGSRPYWLAVTSVGLSLGIAYASIQRWRQMRSLLKESIARTKAGEP